MKRGREESGYGTGQKRPTGPLNPYRRQVPPQMSRLTTSDALSYLRDVKAKFADNKETYDTFLEIMKKFKAQIITTEGVIEQVKSLFRGHRELILGFNTFLPKGFEIHLPLEEDEQPKAAVEFDQAINYVNKIKTRFSSDERVYKAFLEILNMYRKGQKTITNVYEEVAMLFKNHNDLLEEFTYFLPDATPPALQSAPVKKITARARGNANRVNGDPDYGRGMRGGSRSSDVGKELQWVEKVKAKLRSKEGYQEFLKTLNLYGQDIITRSELVMMVQDILARFTDIAHGFDNFLSRLEIAEFEQENVRGRLSTRDTRNKGSQSDKFGLRPISDMDVSSWERSTTSYVKLPKGYPKLKASHVTPIGASVLQDNWVSVTSGSEDYSFKHMRKNQYEEALFRCEDDRFELDMAIECSQSAVRALSDVVMEIATLDAEGRERYRLDRNKVLSIHFRMVQKIYGTGPGERGAEMVDLLKKNPAVAAEVVLGRLTQKIEEWQADKRKMTDVWQKMYDANYHKSLDHRSFYFKQMDKRNLGQKTMMQEIKDVAERRRSEDQTIYLSTTNFATRLTPDLIFDDRHDCVHDDVRKLIKYSMEDMLAAAASDQALDFWHTIVDPFFGLPPQQREPSLKAEIREEQKLQKPSLTALRLQALSGDNGPDSTAPSVTDPGDQDDPASVLDAIGEIASDRMAATVKAEQTGTSEEGVPLSEMGDAEDASIPKAEIKEESQESDQSYLNCKPLAPTDHVRGAHQPDNAPEAGRIFYGNEAFYQFYRLHQHMYERLKTARKCALQISKGPAFRSKSEREQEDAISHMDEHAIQVHNKFMTLVSDLIDGTQDSSVYEDACRHLLGTNSYTLFTLDKLIYKLVKQLQVILADDASMKLAELYRYERSREGKVIDAVYYQNAHIILHEDPTFRFESRPDGPFTMQLLDTDRSEVPAGLLQADFLNYLENYTDSPASIGGQEVESRTRRPFLRRTMMPVVAGAEQDRELAAMHGTRMRNGLECKLMTSTSKVSYVLDTEDWFRRKRQKRGKGFDRQRRKDHFEEWLKNAAKDAALMQLSSASMMMQQPTIEEMHYPASIPGPI